MPALLGGSVARAYADGGPQAVRALAAAGRGPVIEATADPDVYQVTFVFADRLGAIGAVGLFCAAVPGGFARLAPLGEAIFAGTFAVPATARVRYHFCPDPPAELSPDELSALVYSPTARRIDYFNPRLDQVHIRSLRTRLLASLLVLPGATVAPPQPAPTGPHHGTVLDLTTAIGRPGRDWQAALYLPPGHDPDRAATLVLLLHSNDEWRGAEVLHRLPRAAGTASVIGVLLGGGRHYTTWVRALDSPALPGFVAQELLPLVRRHSALADGGHVAAGFSAGAVGAASICAALPERFSRLLAISGAWHLGSSMNVTAAPAAPRLVEHFQRTPTLPHRAYLAAGRYEQTPRQPILEYTAALAAVLARRGSTVRFDEGYTDHDSGSALGYLCAGLPWLLEPAAGC